MSHTRHSLLASALAIAASLVAISAQAAAGIQSHEDLRFLRVATTEDGNPRALQVAIVRYAPDNGDTDLSVDLISAIHVGDKAYYAGLNRRFTDYDALLYELIADKERRSLGRGREHTGIVSNTQVFMKGVLDLAFQLDEIDYNRENFVHADFSPDELSQDMDDRGESLYAYFWRVFFAASEQSVRDPLGLKSMGRMSRAAASENENKVKLAFAYEFAELIDVGEIFGGSGESALIEGRNQRALEILRQRIAAGDRRIGIFYGAGHMPDLDERLRNDLDLARAGITWLDAWLLD